jgi:pSer/pThr/pTyr-binding forkhead associated (FHA) protein
MPLRFRILPASPELREASSAEGRAQEMVQGPSVERTFEIGGEAVDAAGARDEPGEIVVGRGADADLELPFPSVSSRHARLFRGAMPGDWWVEDLGSTNGTWLDGARLDGRRPQPLRPAQRLRLAMVELVFEGWSSTPAGAEGTASMARRLIGDLFGAGGGEAPALITTTGPVRPELRLTERDRRYIVGRGEGSDLTLPLEAVSREHAAVVRRADGVTIQDLGSKNGIRLNGRRVQGESHRLGDGDRIQIGSAELRLSDPEDRYLRRLQSLEDPPPAPAAGGAADGVGAPPTAPPMRLPTPAIPMDQLTGPTSADAAAARRRMLVIGFALLAVLLAIVGLALLSLA